ncbi:Cas10/Cmr2 second palm domain-containing protein [Paraferrimonas haliotis]|uniref:Cas10/Cmr2 second palm domain-containing protein n=1 Tax=Paraferrimonas haliotis TaxID=2013866 RepID=UPI000BA95F4A|nr:hypothetical protein [Paraferrimonas haliotis]
MIYTYLFEVKSIQAYLFESTKLRDVIAASERLDRLIDSNDDNLLFEVLQASGLSSDLTAKLSFSKPAADVDIHFLRCKGGAFYAYATQKSALETLRSNWTLALNTLFPSLVYTDALQQGETLAQAMDSGHAQLAASRNTPSIKLPLATTIAQRYPRTGKLAVPVGKMAMRGSAGEEKELDLETERHRQAYYNLDLREGAALQHRFTPDKLISKIRYPLDFETSFEFGPKQSDLSREQKDAIKDMALIHIDGNGLGKILMKLREELPSDDVNLYQTGFRLFSEALGAATITAAKSATQKLYEQVLTEGYDAKDTVTLPMRPVVLGGDDLTLFCRADLALDYANHFNHAFKQASKEELKVFFDKKYLSTDSLSDYLTASGGILFHKASHPFMHSHHLVEALCDKAKTITKAAVEGSDKVGPDAIAIYRVSNATQSNLADILTQAQTHTTEKGDIVMAQCAYFTYQSDKQNPMHSSHLQNLKALVKLSNNKKAPIPMTRWRQMATELSLANFAEAQRLFFRGRDLCKDATLLRQLDDCLIALNPQQQAEWYWSEGDNMHTFINDLLIVDHYQHVEAK